MNINYQLVYALREKEQAIFAAERKVCAAKDAVANAKAAYKKACAKATGIREMELEFSNTACMAKGICNHVYHIRVHSCFGSPENKCIFCSCDNWSA